MGNTASANVDSSTHHRPASRGTESAAPPLAAPATDVGRVSGRGGIAVTGAKIYFILTGLVQQVVLKAALGLEGYGALSSALAAASIAYNPIVSASLQGVSHVVATSDADRRQALRGALAVHAVIALAAGGAFWALAPALGEIVGATHLVTGLRVLSVVLLLYGLYAPLVGALNGQTRFGMQAALDALAATLRTIGLIGGAIWLERSSVRGFGGVEGATLGFAVSAALVLGVAVSIVGVGRAGASSFTTAGYLRYLGPLLLSQVLLNLLFQADQLLLRRFSADAALAAGLDARAADPLVGAYRATQLFAFLPYQLVLAVSIVLFPLVAKAQREGARDNVTRYVKQAMRFALVFGGLVVSVTSSLPGPLLTLVFGADTAALAALPMRVLSLGLGSLALLGVLTAVLNALERPRLGLAVTGLAFGFVAVLCWLLSRDVPFGAGLLWRTALATSLALVGATVVAGALVRRHAGQVLSARTLVRVLAALASCQLLGAVLPEPSRLLTLLYSVLVGCCYVGVLVLSRELSKHDLEQVRRVLEGRRSRGAPPR